PCIIRFVLYFNTLACGRCSLRVRSSILVAPTCRQSPPRVHSPRSRADDAFCVCARVFCWRSRADDLLRVCTPLARVRTVLSVCALEYFVDGYVGVLYTVCVLPWLVCVHCFFCEHS